MKPEAISDQSNLSRGPLIPELQEYERQFEAISQDAEDLVEGLSDAQFNWRPQPGRWSIAECLEHLNVTARHYLPMLNATLEQARARQLCSQGPFRYGFLGAWFVRTMEPPPKRRFKAPQRFLPPTDQSLKQVIEAFRDLQGQFLACVREANGLHLARAKVRLPATNLIKLSLGQALALMAAHERRHLWQARQVRNDPNFPRS
jgi:hypothetical protein